MRILQSFFVLVLTVICCSTVSAQVKIGDNVSTINAASLLELESTDQGVLMPRLTTAQRDAQNSWAEGHVIYNTTESCFQFFDGTLWKCLGAQEPDVTSSLPFTALSTKGSCKISDYIPETATDTMIIESRLNLIGTAFGEYFYHHQRVDTAMSNHNIIGIHTNTRLIGSNITQAEAHFALPDAAKHIGQSFLFYSVSDVFMPTNPSNTWRMYLQPFHHTANASGDAYLTVDYPEDANDRISHTQMNGVSTSIFHIYRRDVRNLVVPGLAIIIGTLINLDGYPAPVSASPWIIMTSRGSNLWEVSCMGIFDYDKP